MKWGGAPKTSLPLISATQINQFRECQRKWAWAYVAGKKQPPGPGALLGTEVDDTQIQPYLREGRPLDFTRESGYIAAAALEHLPKPLTPGLEIQKHFILPSPASNGSFAYQGFMDLFLPDSAHMPGLPGGAPCVADTKTTKDLKWAKREKALETDVQAMLYATQAIYETRTDAVDLVWIYMQTKAATREAKRKSLKTYLRVTSEHVVDQFKQIEATAKELFEAKQSGVDPLALPPSPSQCDAYGGCPYRHLCNLSPNEVAPADVFAGLAGGGVEMSETNSLMARLAAKKQAAAPAAPAGGSGADHVEQAGIKAALGINPPEKDQIAPKADAADAPATEPKKRGRPRKQPEKDPVGADFAAAAGEPKQLDLPMPAPKEEAPRPVVAIDYDKLANACIDALVSRLGGR